MTRWLLAGVVALLAVAPRAHAVDDVLHPGAVNVDRPTIITLGVQLLITGDDNHDARVAVRYRPTGDPTWRDAMDLFRVRPESVVGRTVPEQFAGSIFELTPGTTYDIELHATDPDGPVDQIIPVTATLRSVPPDDPASPTIRNVSNTATFSAALDAAAPGDVILLAPGTYTGPFSFTASGTAANPIVVRGADEDGVVLDGGGCSSCNVVEAYGSFVHLERLTLAHANRGLRFQGVGAEGNVVRRVHIWDVRLGIGSNSDQEDFYLCDNVVEGRLIWPHVYSDDGGAHSDDDGLNIQGNGHVICHNQIVGFGDAMKFGEDGTRGVDFYGNEILSAYDNGVELDGSEGNTRAFRNRFTNTYATISFQPIFGGPAYALRNIVVNVANEQLKFHSLGGSPPEEPSGMLVLNNTFVSPTLALNLQTSSTSHHFAIENNIIHGPDSVPAGQRVADWSSPVDDGTIDWNGWFPDGKFDFDAPGVWSSFAAMHAGGVFETHGVLLAPGTFASGLTAPPSYTVTMTPPDVDLSPGSPAVDAGMVIANVTDGFTGTAPDMGAWEVGCPTPLYGVRPEGIDETNEPFGCGGPTVTSTTTTTLPYIGVRCTSLALHDDPARPTKRKISFKSTTTGDPLANRIVVPAAGTSGDPTIGGATLTLYDAAGTGQKLVLSLPASSPLAGWSALGSSGYRFRSKDPSVPITSVVVRSDRITLKGGKAGFGYTLSPPPQGSVALRLALGSDRPWCAAAPAKGGTSNDTVKKFVGQPKTPAPSVCPAVP
jgi:hypothetical protein